MYENFLISIVVPTFNDQSALKITLDSIIQNSLIPIQIIIVDGGNEKYTNEILDTSIRKIPRISLLYLKDKAKGVFPAQNMGINAATGEWIMVLNSGDLLSEPAKKVFDNSFLCQFKTEQIVVFSQYAYNLEDNNGYIFKPTAKSIWPHQSILVRKNIYKSLGCYDEGFKYSSDQIFFATIRKVVAFKIVDICLTKYNLSGISSRVNLQHSNEIFIMRRTLGDPYMKAIVRSYVNPYLRKAIEILFNVKLVNSLKRRFFKYYN